MRSRRIAGSIMCAVMLSAGAWLVPGAASASTTLRPAYAASCEVTSHDLWFGSTNGPAGIVIDAEQSCPHLHVDLYKNGVLVASPDSGTGIMTWFEPCHNDAWSTWSDSLGDSVFAPCG